MRSIGVRVFVSALLASGLMTSAAFAAQAWSPVQAPVPPSAASDPRISLTASSCATSSWCVAVGAYTGGDGLVYGLIEMRRGTMWTSTRVPEPADAARHRFSLLSSVSCPSRSRCVAVGTYTNSSNADRPLVVALAGHTWAPAEVPLPIATTIAHLNSVSCANVASCVAVGYAGDRALVMSLSHGAWTATTAPEPTDSANTSAFFRSVSCARTGACVAVGEYLDSGSSYHAFVSTLAGGTWIPVAAPVPSDASTQPFHLSQMFAVSCAAATCAAVGNYVDEGSDYRPLLDIYSHGVWRAVAVSPPSDAVPDPGAVPSTGLYAVSCVEHGSCSAGGTYRTPGVGPIPSYRGLIISGSGGNWYAVTAPEPPNAQTPVSHTVIEAIACGAATRCTAVGTFIDANHNTHGLLATRTRGTWAATAAPEPTNGSGMSSSLHTVSCAPFSTCLAAGGYVDATGHAQGLLEQRGAPVRHVRAP